MFGGALTIAKNPRILVGGRYAHGWTRLLPVGLSPVKEGDRSPFATPHRGSLLYEKVRGVNVLPHRSQRFFTIDQKVRISETLKQMNITPESADILLMRPIKVFMRIEKCIAALVDNFFIADHNIFIAGSSDRKTFKTVVRKMFSMGSYSCRRIVSDYKEWSNNLFHSYADTLMSNGKSVADVNPTNIFRRLDNLSSVRRIRAQGDVTYEDCQVLAHIVSTRNFPYCGKVTQVKAQDVFIEAITRDRVTSPEMVERMREAAVAVGRKIRSIDPTPPSERNNHISLVSTGEYDYKVKNGAQAGATIEALTSFVGKVSQIDRIDETPFGPARYVKGVPIWKTLFREPEECELLLGEWLEPRKAGLEEGVAQSGKCYWGLDEAAARQILYIAYTRKQEADLFSEDEPIPLRASPVGELGDKCRWITICEWWLNVLQAPFSHFYTDIISRHPYAWTSFNKMDQAWEASKAMLKKYGEHHIPTWVSFLSSDLTNATNCQDRVLSKKLLEGVMEGFGYEPTEYDREVLSLLDVDRQLKFPDGTQVRSTNGIFMGEHLAKISLVTLGLCVEELAYRETRNIPFRNDAGDYVDIGMEGYEEDWWRFYHLGGDDHIAGGPPQYLDRITSNFLACGSEISENKHGKSRRVVKYCERIINISQRISDVKTERFNKRFPKLSLIVDSVKCRLLARDDSVSNKAQDTNVAIGKAKALSGCIKWLPKDVSLWPTGKVGLIRSLFVTRMGNCLPNRVMEPKLYALAMLPAELGGFDLNLDGPYDSSETLEWLEQAPNVIKWIVNALHGGWEMTPKIRKCIKNYNSAVTVRGVQLDTERVEKELDELKKPRYRKDHTCITFQEAKELASEVSGDPAWTLSGHEVNRYVARLGYIPESTYRRQLSRADLFTEMAMVGVKNFQKGSWRTNTTRLYDLALEERLDGFGTGILPAVDFQAVLSKLKETGYVQVKFGPVDTNFRKDEVEESNLLTFPLNVELYHGVGRFTPANDDYEGRSGIFSNVSTRERLITRSLQKRYGLLGEDLNRSNRFEVGSFSLQLGDFGRGRMSVSGGSGAGDYLLF